MSELFALAKRANITESQDERVRLKAALVQSGEWLGLLQRDPEDWFSVGGGDIAADDIDQLIAERDEAKANKDWVRADEIRTILAEKKVVLEDGANGTTWRIEK